MFLMFGHAVNSNLWKASQPTTSNWRGHLNSQWLSAVWSLSLLFFYPTVYIFMLTMSTMSTINTERPPNTTYSHTFTLSWHKELMIPKISIMCPFFYLVPFEEKKKRGGGGKGRCVWVKWGGNWRKSRWREEKGGERHVSDPSEGKRKISHC